MKFIIFIFAVESIRICTRQVTGDGDIQSRYIHRMSILYYNNTVQQQHNNTSSLQSLQ
ncbi:MAG: hypothetical protein ACI8RD_012106 [Bacillariaceae sp.]|jgi:hypothetical protein